MKFIQQKNLPFALWGTKRGKQIFILNNIENDASLENTFSDIRNYLQFNGRGVEYIIFEKQSDCYIFSMASTITDWVGRAGFFAISLVVPNNKTLTQTEKIPALLKQLSNEYYNRYIKGSQDESIRTDIKEDPLIFSHLIKQSGIEIKEASNTQWNVGTEKVSVNIETLDNQTITNFFQYYQQRNDIDKYQRIVFIPKNKKDTTCSYPEVTIPIYKPITSLLLRITDENGAMIDAYIYLKSTDATQQKLTYQPTQAINIENVQEIQVQAPGYEPIQLTNIPQIVKEIPEGMPHTIQMKKIVRTYEGGMFKPTNINEQKNINTNEVTITFKDNKSNSINTIITVKYIDHRTEYPNLNQNGELTFDINKVEYIKVTNKTLYKTDLEDIIQNKKSICIIDDNKQSNIHSNSDDNTIHWNIGGSGFKNTKQKKDSKKKNGMTTFILK